MSSDQEAPKDAYTYTTENTAVAQSSGRPAEEIDELQESRKKALKLLEELAERTSDLEKLNSHYAHILKGIYASMQRRLKSQEEDRPAA